MKKERTDTARTLALSAMMWPNYICYTGRMRPYMGVGMSREDLKEKLSWEEAKGKTLSHSISFLLKGKEQRTMLRKTWDWQLAHLFPLRPYVHISESSGKRKITFSNKKHFSPKVCKTWWGKKSSAKLAGCHHPGFLEEAVLGGSSKGNTYLNGAGQCRWHQDNGVGSELALAGMGTGGQ